MRVVSAVASLLLLDAAAGSFCHWSNGSSPVPHGPQNLYPINAYDNATSFVAAVPNGKLLNVTVPHDGGATVSHFPVFHVYGNATERGTALGSLMKHVDAREIVDSIWQYFKDQVTGALPGWVPKWLGDLIAQMGLEAALGLTYDITKKYTTPEYYDEMHAVADAAGIDFVKLRDMNMIAGLTQGKCSMFGAWGEALAEKDGLLQLRALDWNMDAPIVNNPAMVVFHTPESTYATVGIVGLMGALTGVSSNQLGISEIGVSFPDATFGKESRFGVPFIFLLRDILHSDKYLENSITRMQNAKRTCNLILGVGDGKPGAGGGKGFRGFQYSSSVCNVVDDTNLIPKYDWHAPIDNIVYWGMDWICPGDTQALHDQLKKNYGQLTAEVAIRDVTAVETSGDTHLAYYDLKGMSMWVSFARQSYLSGPENAYARQFTKIDLHKLFAEPKP